MSLTKSKMPALGFTAPDFSLLEAKSGQILSLSALKSEQATVVMFICNHCPYVVHILDTLVEVAATYQAKGVAFIAISANDVQTHPADAPDKMAQLATEKAFSFPYLYDASQAVAKAYEAACTPDFFVFDGDLQCVYRGRFDGASPGRPEPVTGSDLCQALEQLLAGQPVSTDQKASMGCNIKWTI